jgi:hypothetical protein
MKTKKSTKKTFKPTYTVDITNCEDPFDVLVQFGLAKQNAGLPITDDELNAIIDDNAILVVIHDITIKREDKKLPWYKRLWKKMFGKKD